MTSIHSEGFKEHRRFFSQRSGYLSLVPEQWLTKRFRLDGLGTESGVPGFRSKYEFLNMIKMFRVVQGRCATMDVCDQFLNRFYFYDVLQCPIRDVDNKDIAREYSIPSGADVYREIGRHSSEGQRGINEGPGRAEIVEE
ncbi:hypothetical protein CBL_12559 [Carabus blaptoides fortunei]